MVSNGGLYRFSVHGIEVFTDFSRDLGVEILDPM